jgi:hypothetical protein
MSADGRQLTAAVKGGLLYSSSDSGTTWVAASVPAANWKAVAGSANGAALVAVVQGGVIFSLISEVQTPAVPALQIQLVQGNVVLAWPAGGAAVVLQQSTNLLGSNWTDVPVTPTVTNGQNQVTVPMTGSQTMYRLRSQ